MTPSTVELRRSDDGNNFRLKGYLEQMTALESDRMSKSWISWVVFLAIWFLAAAIGSVFTADSVKTWYPTLAKLAGTPPAWVFGPSQI